MRCLFDALEPRVLLSHTGLDTQIFYPEGYVHGDVVETVLISNMGSEPTEFELVAHYEIGERDQILASGVLVAGESLDVNIAGEGVMLVRPHEPFALEVRSEFEVQAVLHHDDFGGSTEGVFEGAAHQNWAIPISTKDNQSHEFIVFYNPTNEDAIITVSGVDAQAVQFELTSTIEAGRRGGWSLRNELVVPDGVFSVTVSSSQPILTASSHYNPGTGDAYTRMGNRIVDSGGGSGGGGTGGGTGGGGTGGGGSGGGGSGGGGSGGGGSGGGGSGGGGSGGGGTNPELGEYAGLIFDIEFSDGSLIPGNGKFVESPETTIVVSNDGEVTATVELVFLNHDESNPLTGNERTIEVDAGERVELDVATLGFPVETDLGLVYQADGPVTVSALVSHRNKTFEVTATEYASTEWSLSNSVLNQIQNGVIRNEELLVFNPTDEAVEVQIEFVRANGDVYLESMVLESHAFGEINAERLPPSWGSGQPYQAVTLTSSVPLSFGLEYWARKNQGTYELSTLALEDLVPIAELFLL